MKISIPTEPCVIAANLLRISFGLSLLFVGLSHFTDLESFSLVVGDGLELFGWLTTIYAYLHPCLLIFGGALFVVNRFPALAAWAAGIPLCMIPAGMLFKTVFGLDLADMMAAAINAWIWLAIYMIVVFTCLGDKHHHQHATLMPHLPGHQG